MTHTLSFDIGYASIGWALLSKSSGNPHPQIVGTGVVTFPKDDCLASARRVYRRQRRHIRSTRQRIQRLEKLLVHLGVFTDTELQSKHTQGGGHPAPWLLAARVLASNGKSEHLLNWSQLWDVIRWYAHNRGYDGNRRWAGISAFEEQNGTLPREAQKKDDSDFVFDEDDDETEKVENARALLKEHGTSTMAETVTAIMFHPHGMRKALDIPPGEPLPPFKSASRYKAKNAAFPREIVEVEVSDLLRHHIGHLPLLTEDFISLLFDQIEDRTFLKSFGIHLPKRFQDGLLFGQFVPRFDNRIISTCLVSGEKVPSKASKEFLLYRWLMQVANVRVVRAKPELNQDERVAIHQQMAGKGFFTPGEFKKVVRSITCVTQDNLDTMLMHPEIDKALILDPVKRLIASERVQYLWPYYPERIRKRAAGKWLGGKILNHRVILDWCESLGHSASDILTAARNAIPKKGKAPNELSILSSPLKTEWPSGRAPFHRAILQKACNEVLAGYDPRKKSRANDPSGGEDKQADGVLVRDTLTNAAPPPFPPFEKWHARWTRKPANAGKSVNYAESLYQEAKAQSLHDSRTNNHLIRHRLLILQRLLKNMIDDPTLLNGDTSSISGVAVEVSSEIKEMSGKDSPAIQKILNEQMGNFRSVVKKLNSSGIHHPSAGLIRKARIAEDLNWYCPYTGRGPYDAHDLEKADLWDKDHIIPYSQRPSNSLDSLVITSKAINNAKGNRTALEFIEWINQPENLARRDQLGVWTPKQFRTFVDKLEVWKGHDDDKKRKRRRKQLLLLPKWDKKDAGFLPRDLTVTSHLNRLAALSIQRILGIDPHLITSIPGSVTGTLRTQWKLLGTLQSAAPGVIDKETGDLKIKTEIRNVTHLHHALDAIVIGLTHHYFRKDGGLWESLVRRPKQRSVEDNRRLLDTGLFIRSADEGRPIVELDTHIPPELESQIRARLAERRVVQHLPADMSGMIVEDNTRGVVKIDEDGTVHLRQTNRDSKTGKLSVKPTKESPEKLIGLRPGKLADQKGVRVITANYGVAILDESPLNLDGSPGKPDERFVVIPFAGVWKRLQHLKLLNKGKRPEILRQGSLIEIPTGQPHAGIWMVRGITNDKRDGKLVELCWADVVDSRQPGVIWTWPKASLRVLWNKSGARVIRSRLSGSESKPTIT